MAPRGRATATTTDTYGVVPTAAGPRSLDNQQPKKRGPKPGFKRSNQSVPGGQSTRAPASRIWQYDSHSVSIASTNTDSNSSDMNNKQRYSNDPYTFQCDSFTSSVNYHEQASNTKQATRTTTTSSTTTTTATNNSRHGNRTRQEEYGHQQARAVATQTTTGPRLQASNSQQQKRRGPRTTSANTGSKAAPTVILDERQRRDHQVNDLIDYNSLNLVEQARGKQNIDCNDTNLNSNTNSAQSFDIRNSNQYITTDNELNHYQYQQQQQQQQLHHRNPFDANADVLIRETNCSTSVVSRGSSSDSSNNRNSSRGQFQEQPSASNIVIQQQQSASASCNATRMIVHHKPSHPQMQIQAQHNHHQLPQHHNHHHAASAAPQVSQIVSPSPPQLPPPPPSQMVIQGHGQQQQQQANSEQINYYNATNDTQHQQYLTQEAQAYPSPQPQQQQQLHNSNNNNNNHHHLHQQQQQQQYHDQHQHDQTAIMPNRFDDPINGGGVAPNRVYHQQYLGPAAPNSQANSLNNKVHHQVSQNTHQNHQKHHSHQAQAPSQQQHQGGPIAPSAPYQPVQHTHNQSYGPTMQQQQQTMPLHNSGFPVASEAPQMQVPRANHLTANGNGGRHPVPQPILSQQQQQQQQQHRVAAPPYASQQQQHTPVRSITTNSIVNHAQQPHQHPQLQQSNRIIGPRAVVSAVPQQNPTYRQQQAPHVPVNQQQASHLLTHNHQQQQQQPISSPSHVIGGDLSVDQYASSSPNLMQQQSNRQRFSGQQQPLPAQQQRPVAQLHQAPTGIQRRQSPNNHLAQRPPSRPIEFAPPHANMIGNRHAVGHGGEPTISDMQHSHHNRPPPSPLPPASLALPPHGAQQSGPYYQQQPQQQQQQNQQSLLTATRPSLHKQSRPPQQQHMRHQVMQQQQQQPQQLLPVPQQQQPMDNHHLLCNPTPPLTPNAAPPHLMGPRQGGGMASGPAPQLMGGPDEWQQQSHHQHHHNGPLSDQLQQQHQPLPHQHHQPAQVSSGFNGGAPGLGVVSQTVHTNQPKAVPANHINHYNNNHPGQQQPMPILVGGSPQIVPMHPQQRMDSTVATATAPPATTVMPKSNTIQYHPAPQQATPSHAPLNNHHFAHSNPAATGVSSGTMIDQPPPHAGNTRQQQQQQSIAPPDSSRQVRLTLPSQLLGPFRLEHGVQCTSKVFHIKKDLFDALSKSMSPYGAQTAANIQELQFRAYLIDQHHQRDNKSTTGGGDSLLAHNHHHHNHNHHPHQSQQQHHSSPLASTNACNWPELFQISINQQVVHLDRSTVSPPSIGCGPAGSSNGKPPLAHKAVDIFQYCNLGDNIIDIQVNDCYCSHEFVLELVDRPTLKAFINSCFKSRLLSNESCLNKLHSNFGAPGFLVQQAPGTNSGIFNEYITEYIQQPNGQQVEQTRARISLRCPITGRRMRTPARGLNCKHIQCFDLENFIYQNHNRTRWNCPLCSQPIPFTMLELDQFQMNIVQSMSSIQNTDDVLIDPNGQWQSYYAPSSPLPPQNATNPVKTQHQPRNGPSGGNTPAMHYQQQQQQQQQNMGPGHHQSVQRIQQAPPQSSGGSGSGQMMMQHTTAKANGTFHPQLSMPPSSGMSSPAMVGMASNHGMHQSPARPMSGGGCIGQSSPASGGSNWDHQHVGSQPPAELRSSPPGGVRRPPSAMGQSSSTGSRSATGGTLAKRANNNSSNNNYASSRYSSPQPGPMCTGNQSPQIASQPHGQPALSGPGATPAPGYFHAPESGDTDELSPLAAMERTIIQHEQQMGPPPFDPNSLTSSPLKPAGPVGPQPPIAQSPSSASNNFASPQHQQMSTAIQPSPAEVLANQKTSSAAGSAGGFSPLPSQPVPSPAATGRSTVPASPQAQQTRLPQSPMQQQQHQHQTTVSAQMSISTPATPLQIHGGPETPATPSNSVQQHCGPNSVSASHQNNSPHVGSGAGGHVVDHQPLSNGSASVASITSTSTLTPSGQSLGSVGMGGDSRCNTAPLQNALGSLDDLVVLPGVGGSAQGSGVGGGNSSSSGGLASGHPSAAYSKQQSMPGGSASNNGDDDDHNVVQFDDKSDIFMSKLMMDSNDSLLRDRSHHELALALEEAEWKQQLDRGKSEHLANFLNEPLMNKRHHHNHHHQHSDNRHHHHHHNQDDQQHHYQHHNNGNNNNNDNHHQAGDVDGANKMLSGGLNPSDDEGNSSPHGSSPGHNGLDQLDHYTNYLDSGSADDGAGLPPDDSILDLFER